MLGRRNAGGKINDSAQSGVLPAVNEPITRRHCGGESAGSCSPNRRRLSDVINLSSIYPNVHSNVQPIRAVFLVGDMDGGGGAINRLP